MRGYPVLRWCSVVSCYLVSTEAKSQLQALKGKIGYYCSSAYKSADILHTRNIANSKEQTVPELKFTIKVDNASKCGGYSCSFHWGLSRSLRGSSSAAIFCYYCNDVNETMAIFIGDNMPPYVLELSLVKVQLKENFSYSRTTYSHIGNGAY